MKWILYAATAFVVIPYIFNLVCIQLISVFQNKMMLFSHQVVTSRRIVQWYKTPDDDYLWSWLSTYVFGFIFIAVVSGGCLTSAEFLNSKFGHHRFFRMGLRYSELQEIQQTKIKTVVLLEVCEKTFVKISFFHNILLSPEYSTSGHTNLLFSYFFTAYYGRYYRTNIFWSINFDVSYHALY